MTQTSNEAVSKITHIDKNVYQELLASSNDLYLVDFWADWCGPCKLMNPYLEKVSVLPEFEGKLKIAKVDTDSNPELSMQYKITGIPCFIFIKFENGVATEKARIIGASDYITFVKKIQENLATIK